MVLMAGCGSVSLPRTKKRIDPLEFARLRAGEGGENSSLWSPELNLSIRNPSFFRPLWLLFEGPPPFWGGLKRKTKRTSATLVSGGGAPPSLHGVRGVWGYLGSGGLLGNERKPPEAPNDGLNPKEAKAHALKNHNYEHLLFLYQLWL